MKSVNTYRPAALIALVFCLGSFLSLIFQILYRSLDIAPIPSGIESVILQLTIVSFLGSTLAFAYFWLDNNKNEAAWAVIVRNGSLAAGLSFILIPEYIYVLYPKQFAFPAYTQLYLFLQVFLLQLYLSLFTFHFRKIMPANLIGLKRIVWKTYIGLLVLALFSNFTKDFIPNFFRVFHVTLAFVFAVYLSINMKWVVDVPASKRVSTILWLLFISSIHFFLIYHYYNEESHGFFNVLSLPTEYYLILLFIPTVFSTTALFANIFYLSLAKVVDRKENEIRSLTQMSKFIQKKENLDGVFNFLLNNCVNDSEAHAGWILLRDNQQKETLKSKNINIDRAMAISQAFLSNYAEQLRLLQYVSILNTENTKPEIKNIGNYKSLLVCNIELHKGESGMLFLVNEEEESFDDQSVEMVRSYIDQARIVYENQRLFSESVKSESVKRELEVASQIHKSLLPTLFPQNSNYEIAAFMETSKELGGDFYDYFHLDENRLALIIGDVSGKGIPAALYMAEIKGIFNSLAQFDLSPEEIILKANETISKCFDKNHFVTLIYLVIDVKHRKFYYLRCGHCPILYYDFTVNKTDYFNDSGIGLGIIRNSEYSNHVRLYEREFHTNDLLVLYTDGLIEATDKKTKKSFGLNELKLALETARKLNAEEALKDVLNEFKITISLQENPDDLALIVIKFL